MSHKDDGYRNVMVTVETAEQLDALAEEFKKTYPIIRRVTKPMLIEALVRAAVEQGVESGGLKVGPLDA